jgi:2-oxoglutarate ferredoxin oxidoreductase subunit alpha
MRTLLVNECGVDPARFVSVLHFDGMPITARFITAEVAARLRALNVVPVGVMR